MSTLSVQSASVDRSNFLRRVLFVDAATCAMSGALMALDAAPLSVPLGLPAALLSCCGLSLLPIAAFMLWVATRRDMPRLGVWLVIAGNAGWVLGSALLLMVFSTSPLGSAFVIAQAVVTALLAELEYLGLRRVLS